MWSETWERAREGLRGAEEEGEGEMLGEEAVCLLWYWASFHLCQSM